MAFGGEVKRSAALALAVLLPASAEAQANAPRLSSDESRAVAALRKLFGPTRPPARLETLYVYQLRTGLGYAEDFAIDTEASVGPWVGDDLAAARSLAPFATKTDGSVFALWLPGATAVDDAPVVLLDSEGRGSCVLAGSTAEFLSLLTLGASLPDLRPADEDAVPDLEAFRKWMSAELSVEAPKRPAAILEKASSTHPGLQRWLDQHRPALGSIKRTRTPR